MTDEIRPADPTPAEETVPPISEELKETPEEAAQEPQESEAPVEEQDQKKPEEEKKKLDQAVDVQDSGPCKKHLKVTIPRTVLDNRFEDKYKELVKGETSTVPGFRPGKAPRRLIERRFHKEVSNEVKAEVLLASLEQLGEDLNLAVLAPPNLDPLKVELPQEGPLVYEFDVEVRPEFDLPNYRGLKINRPVKEITDLEVQREERRFLSRYGQVVPKPEGNAQEGDVLVSDVIVRDGNRVINSFSENTVRIDQRLAFKDGVAEHFAEQVQGANPGDTRVVDITLTSNVADPNLRDRSVQAFYQIKEIKAIRPPDLTPEFLQGFGVHTPEQLQELVRVLLQRRLAHAQRQASRAQVIEQLLGTTQLPLPQDLVRRQARKAMARRIMEMRSDGISEEEIRGQQRVMERDIINSTALALRESFVLQKIAEQEKLEVSEEDIDDEIERLADQAGESPRRVRARLEKEELLEALGAELLERKALDLILESAEYTDVPMEDGQQVPVTPVDEQTVPGEMQDSTAEPPAAPEEDQAKETTS
jgi:trigger factor